VPIVSLLVYTLAAQPTTPTLGRFGEAVPPVTTTFRTLSAPEALQLQPAYIDLGALVTNEPVESPPLLVRNVSGRTLSLSAQAKRLPGLHVKLEPSQLEPGESAQLIIYGRPGKPGGMQGYIRLTAFDGYLEVEIPVTGRVKVPPEEGCESLLTDFSLLDDEGTPPHCSIADELLAEEPLAELPSDEADDAEASPDDGDAGAQPDPAPESEPAIPIIEPFVPPAPGEAPIIEPFDREPSAGPAPIVEDFSQNPAPPNDEPTHSEEVRDDNHEAAHDEDLQEPRDAELEEAEPERDTPSTEESSEPV